MRGEVAVTREAYPSIVIDNDSHAGHHIRFLPYRRQRFGADCEGHGAQAGAQVLVSRIALGSNLLMIGAAELAFAGLLADPAGYSKAHIGAPAGSTGRRGPAFTRAEQLNPFPTFNG